VRFDLLGKLAIGFLPLATPANADFNVVLLEHPPEGCTLTVDRNYSIGGSNLDRTQYISFRSEQSESYISNSRTTISIYSSTEGAISGCTAPEDWVKKSDVAPMGIEVVVAAASCTFSRPAGSTAEIVIAYDIGHSIITNQGDERRRAFYITVPRFLADPDDFSYVEYQNYRSIPDGIAPRTCTRISLE